MTGARQVAPTAFERSDVRLPIHRLVVIHYPFFGGPHNQALRLDAPLRLHGVRTTVVLPDEPGNAAARLRGAGVDVLELPLARIRSTASPVAHSLYGARFLRDVARLRAIISSREVDLVEVAGLANPQGAVAGRIARVPVVWQILDTYTPAVLRRGLMPVVRRLSDAVMTTGHAVEELHFRRRHLGERAVVFYPPVDTAVFRPELASRRSIRRELGVEEHEILVGTIANLTPMKNLEQLLHLAPRLRAELPNVRLAIFGRPMETHLAYGRQIQREAARSGILCVDAGSRVPEFFRSLDIFVLVSHAEGVSTTVLEAMASGLPVVTVDVASLPEVVDDGRTGCVIRRNDMSELVAALKCLTLTRDRRLAMGSAGRAKAVRLFGVDTCAETHIRAYDLAIANRARRHAHKDDR